MSLLLTLLARDQIKQKGAGGGAGGYGFYGAITIDNTKVSGSSDLTNFPVPISGVYDGTGSEPDIRTVANGGKIQNTDATGGADGATTVPADLVFSPNTDGSSPYSFEIEKYDATTGEIVAWVKIPTLSYNADTTLYMVYGDSSVTTTQEDIANVWTAYTNVWHLSGSYDATTGEVRDSAGANHGQAYSSSYVPVQVDGQVGKGQDFQGADLITCDGVTDPYAGAESITMEAWFNPDTLTAGRAIFRKSPSLLLDPASPSSEIRVVVWDSDEMHITVSTNASMSTSGGWYHIVTTTDLVNDTTTIHVNGVAKTVNKTFAGIESGMRASTDPLQMGGNWDVSGGNPGDFLDAQLDEMRIHVGSGATALKSADWTITNYNAQNDPSTFYSVGSETAN